VAYNQVLEALEDQLLDDPNDDKTYWTVKDIIAHEGPLTPDSPSYKGSWYNVLVAWEDGSQTYEPLHVIAADSPTVCAIYAKRAELLDTPGWKRFKQLANWTKAMEQPLNQARTKSFRRAPLFKFGYQVPRSHSNCVAIDMKNENTKWHEAEALKMKQLAEYDTFDDFGKGCRPPEGYKRINVHFVYDVKQDGRHKARLVAGGHLTDVPIESILGSSLVAKSSHRHLSRSKMDLNYTLLMLGMLISRQEPRRRSTLLVDLVLVSSKVTH